MKWQPAIILVLIPYATLTAGQVNCEKLTLIPLALCSQSEESSWIFRPSYFSHDPATGKRVAQYAQEPTSYRREDPTYLQSGYRHNQSILRGADGSADRQHIVETWGKGELIRPYGEWLFPYRAGATPYGPWGNPQGPWTLPFDSWQNPYGLLQHWPTPYGSNGPYGPGGGGYPGAMSGYGSGYGMGSGSSHAIGPGPSGPPTPHGPGGDMDD